jgi:hypothetical protein
LKNEKEEELFKVRRNSHFRSEEREEELLKNEESPLGI